MVGFQLVNSSQREEAMVLVRDAIAAGIFNDLVCTSDDVIRLVSIWIDNYFVTVGVWQ